MTATTAVRPDPVVVDTTIDLTKTVAQPMESRWRIVLRGALMGVGLGTPPLPEGTRPAGADRPIDPGVSL